MKKKLHSFTFHCLVCDAAGVAEAKTDLGGKNRLGDRGWKLYGNFLICPECKAKDVTDASPC
jgi:hypothetical protein